MDPVPVLARGQRLPRPQLGPAGQLTAHVAVLPLRPGSTVQDGGRSHGFRGCLAAAAGLRVLLSKRSHLRGTAVARRSAGIAGKPPPDSESGLVNEVTAPAILVLMAILYGGNVPLLKTVELEAPMDLTAPELLALRFISAAVVSLPFFTFNFKQVRSLAIPSVELAFWLFFGYALQILGLEKTSASTCAVATALTGPFVQVLEFVVDGKQFTPLVVACSVGTFAGLALFVSAPSLATPVPPLRAVFERLFNFLSIVEPPAPMPHEALLKDVPGELLAILGTFFFAVHVYRSNRIIGQSETQQAEEGEGSDDARGDDFAVGLAAVQLVAAAVICVVASSFDSPYTTGEQLSVAERLSPAIWAQIVACGLLCTGLPAVVELFAFKFVGPAIASLIYCTIPLWGTLLSVVFLQEKLGPQAILASLLILTSSLGPSVYALLNPEETEESFRDL
ncbi:unnamed protein product [Symbiodinium natans]|uniref:EamA domain-containing protein n=1 Tax=Symbiodinium natans TaxID=878477 RepID=A0A812U4V4_9DINO|nr:unnamed protein product [Symbiodinium natans]